MVETPVPFYLFDRSLPLERPPEHEESNGALPLVEAAGPRPFGYFDRLRWVHFMLAQPHVALPSIALLVHKALPGVAWRLQRSAYLYSKGLVEVEIDESEQERLFVRHLREQATERRRRWGITYPSNAYTRSQWAKDDARHYAQEGEDEAVDETLRLLEVR